jgi:hypothetical protein
MIREALRHRRDFESLYGFRQGGDSAAHFCPWTADEAVTNALYELFKHTISVAAESRAERQLHVVDEPPGYDGATFVNQLSELARYVFACNKQRLSFFMKSVHLCGTTSP